MRHTHILSSCTQATEKFSVTTGRCASLFVAVLPFHFTAQLMFSFRICTPYLQQHHLTDNSFEHQVTTASETKREYKIPRSPTHICLCNEGAVTSNVQSRQDPETRIDTASNREHQHLDHQDDLEQTTSLDWVEDTSLLQLASYPSEVSCRSCSVRTQCWGLIEMSLLPTILSFPLLIPCISIAIDCFSDGCHLLWSILLTIHFYVPSTL